MPGHSRTEISLGYTRHPVLISTLRTLSIVIVIDQDNPANIQDENCWPAWYQHAEESSFATVTSDSAAIA
jgi:hypothetical protein